MPVVTDPLASLTTWPVNFSLGGRNYTIPGLPASVWLMVLLEEFGTFEQVVELLPMQSKAQIEQDIIDGAIDHQEKEQTFRDAVEVVAGRPWWVVLNYLNLISSFWSRFHGRILLSGLDVEKVPLGAYLDAAHFAFIEGRDEQNTQKIINFLETPPPGFDIELDEQSEGDTFLAMMNQSR